MNEGLLKIAFGCQFNSHQEAEKGLESHEIATNTKFAVHATDGEYNKEGFDLEKHRILFEDIKRNGLTHQIEFNGIPFIVLGTKRYDCAHGKDRAISSKRKYKEAKIQKANEDHNFVKNRYSAQNTRKMDCSAVVIMRDIILFHEYKATANTKGCKRTVTEKMKKNWTSGEQTLPYKRLFLVQFPSNECHSNHLINEFGGMSQQVDKRLITKIHELVNEGVRDIGEIKRCLIRFVSDNLFSNADCPPSTSRRFFPQEKDIRNHVNKAENKLKFSKIDQENLYHKILIWKEKNPDDSFFFRGYRRTSNQDLETERLWFNEHGDRIPVDDPKNTKEETRLLFVHQKSFQKRILNRYGNAICLLDAAYRTTKYAVPLFFVVVKTNVDYQVVASFAIQDENTQSIKEALDIIKFWNPEWSPICFMIDNCEEEKNAISQIFPYCRIFWCDFHREQAWSRWLSSNHNGMRDKRDVILPMLRRIAASETIQEFDIRVKELKENAEWKTDKAKSFRNYFENIWLKNFKLWVKAFRSGLLEISVNTNNGVERKNKDFKYGYLAKKRSKTLSAMTTSLVEQFLPDKQNSYVQSNFKSSSLYRTYDGKLPNWLYDRPKKYVAHVIERLKAIPSFGSSMITSTGRNKFLVKSENQNCSYTTFLGDDRSFPYCTCFDWKKFLLPCKHIIAVLNYMDGISWESLGLSYRDSVFFKIDSEVFGIYDDHSIEEKQSNGYCAEESEIGENEIENRCDHQTFATDLPLPLYQKKSKASSCRELLKEISSLTYNVSDLDVLEELEKDLLASLENLKSSVVVDCGLVLESPKPAEIKRHIKFKELNEPKIKKSKLSGRVGIQAEKQREYRTLNINVKNQNPKVTEELVGDNDSNIYDIPPLNNPGISNVFEVSSSEDEVEEENLPEKEERVILLDREKSEEHLRVFPVLIDSLKIKSTCIFKTVIKNECYSLTYLDLLTLETTHSSYQIKQIKHFEPSFQPGWLKDEVINSYLSNLEIIHDNVLYCGSAVALVIAAGKSFRNLWKQKNLSSKSHIFIPYNENGSHWVLIYVNILECSVTLLDPLERRFNSSLMETANFIASTILHTKFNKKLIKEESMCRVFQKDSFNCGVFVCWYAHRISSGSSLDILFDPTAFRRHIYDCICGNCLKNVDGDFFDSKSTCKVCGKKGDEEEIFGWAQCERCDRWFHCGCIGKTIKEARNLQDFFCP